MEKNRLAALDGLRGICAVIVLLFHVFRHENPNLFAHGFLSVDIFFLLSGFVLAFAFGDRLEASLNPAAFMRARIRRLGPVLWFGAGFSILGCLVMAHLSQANIPFYAVLFVGIQNALLIPMVGASTADAFPLNGPSWSLFAEFWINAGFALVATWLRPALLAAVIAGGWIFLVLHTLQLGTADFGAAQSTILYAIPRSLPSFACGVLIFKLWRRGALRFVPSVPPLLVFALWAAISLFPGGGPLFDLAQITIVGPLMLVLLANTTHATPAWCLWLGRLSYPLYATHAVIVEVGRRLVGAPLDIWSIIALCLSALLLADLLARLYEPAVRRGAWLWRNTAGSQAA